MRNNLLPAVLIIFITISPVFASGKQEKKDSKDSDIRKNLELLLKAEKTWKKLKVSAYRSEIIYTRAAMPPERMSLTVRGGIVTDFRAGREDAGYPASFIESLTVESMFSRMKASLEERLIDGRKSPMILEASYDDKAGYIKKLSRVPRPMSGDAGAPGPRPPMDANYHIEIVSLEILAKE